MIKLKPKTGRVLISDPFLKDPNFLRTVVILAEFSEQGAVGFVLNNPVDIRLSKLLKDNSLPGEFIHQGGPVELNTLHFLHNLGQILPGSTQIASGIWWGGEYQEALKILRQNPELIEHFRFYLGYSGWSGGQLESELEDDAWVVADIRHEQIFNRNPEDPELWKELIKSLGGDYRYLSDAPIDPSLN